MMVFWSTAVMSCTSPQEEKREKISLALLYPGGRLDTFTKFVLLAMIGFLKLINKFTCRLQDLFNILGLL